MPILTGATLVESFESGDLSGWNALELSGVTTTATTDRATDGTYSATNTFTVLPSYAGWTIQNVLSRDPRSIMTANATTISIDVYSDWANSNGWGVYEEFMFLTVNYDGGYSNLSPSSGTLVNGEFSTITWDVSGHAAGLANPAATYSFIEIGWHLGTWMDDAMNNGTQTIAVDNITVTSVPEPSTAAILCVFGASILLGRRRA
ncbi:MAG: hypothetical protein ACSHYB_00130 [Roseibacillus sp.]